MNSARWGVAWVLVLMVINAWNTHGIDFDLRIIAMSVIFLAGIVAEKV